MLADSSAYLNDDYIFILAQKRDILWQDGAKKSQKKLKI
jgi:hypothetical protein